MATPTVTVHVSYWRMEVFIVLVRAAIALHILDQHAALRLLRRFGMAILNPRTRMK